MRITLFLLAFICLQLNAQNETKAALTAGSEFLDFKTESHSITSGYQIIDYQGYTYYKFPPREQQLSHPPATPLVINSPYRNNSLIYIIVFLLIATALLFITTKNKNRILAETDVHLETEENDNRKKQLWDAMSEPAIDE